MKSLRELRNNTINFSNVFKAFKEAEEYLRSLEGLEEKEKNLKSSIAGLVDQYQKLAQRNSEVGAIHDEAQAKAASLLSEAQAKADKLANAAKLLVDDANKKVQDAISKVDGHNQRAVAAKKKADDTESDLANLTAQLDELKAHKARIVKSLSE